MDNDSKSFKTKNLEEELLFSQSPDLILIWNCVELMFSQRTPSSNLTFQEETGNNMDLDG